MMIISLKKRASSVLSSCGLVALQQGSIITPVIGATVKANGTFNSLTHVSWRSHVRLRVNQVWDGRAITHWLSQSKRGCILFQFTLASLYLSTRIALRLFSNVMPQHHRHGRGHQKRTALRSAKVGLLGSAAISSTNRGRSS
ncbi:MAG: hypothetical protein GY832_01775 [Chloroflexi bacterium]|nr:hypothetical protein [Chloroflexota bacterium]